MPQACTCIADFNEKLAPEQELDTSIVFSRTSNEMLLATYTTINPPDYVLAPECWYTTAPSKKYPQGRPKFGPLPVDKQISAIGNSVCPPVARALIAANQPCERHERRAA